MNSLVFEQLFSHPVTVVGAAKAPLRDIVYAYFLQITLTEERADQLTKQYIDELATRFITRAA